MKRDLVVFGEDWGSHPSSTQHLIKRLRQQRKVVWVNSIGLRRPRLSWHDAKRLVAKVGAMFNTSHPVTTLEEMAIIHPRVLPLPGNPMARGVNRQLLEKSVRDKMQQVGIEKPILWISLPTAVDMVGRLAEHAAVYYCGDDFSALAGVDHEPVARLEAELVERVDLILAASPTLLGKFPQHKTRLLAHGVDCAHFSQAAPRPQDLPQGKPIAGFYGNLADWIDLELLVATAKRLPHWNFVLVGPVNTDVGVLAMLENVHLLGEKPHAVLPAYVQHWHVSLMPFKDTAQIRASNPLKLREYLAVGKPIVSTEFPALDGYRDLLVVATQAEEFARAIENASINLPAWAADGELEDHINSWQEVTTLDELSAMRRQRVAGETWEIRAEEVSAMLDAL